MIKVAHSVVVTPGRCGLYETTRDLIDHVRGEGVDARMVDPDKERNKLHPAAPDDRAVPIADMEWAKSADIIVSHSGLGEVLEKVDVPFIHVAHGRPRSSFISEVTGSTPIYSYQFGLNKDPRFKAIVNFLPEHVPYHKVMMPNKDIYSITAPVDLDKWTPEGPSGYKFHGHAGAINVVCTDAWRDDIDPFVVVNAFALFAREVKGAKLHIYGGDPARKGWGALIKTIRDSGHMGEYTSWVNGLENVYRAADMLITPHNIEVRSIREAMACGCPVVSDPEHFLFSFVERMKATLNSDRGEVRKSAEKRFNPVDTAKQFVEIIKKVKGAA